MKITNLPHLLARECCPLRFDEHGCLIFIALMKPRVMLLAVFTAFAGLMIAPVSLDPLLGFACDCRQSPSGPVPLVCSICGTTPTSMP